MADPTDTWGRILGWLGDQSQGRLELTAPERRLWEAYPTGERVVLGHDVPGADAPGERTVRAQVIASLLLGACNGRSGNVPAVRLGGALITGQLDVSGGTVGCELRLERCRLEATPDFSNAQTRQLRLSGCHMPGFDGGGLRTDGYLSLSASVITGQVRLTRANLSGGFRLNGTHITHVTDEGEWALFGGGLIVEAGTFWQNAKITGPVRLTGARMGGGLFLYGATLSNPGGIALDGQNMIVEDALELSRGFTAEGSVRLRGARINGTLSFDQAALRAPGGRALHGSHMQVDELLLYPREPVQGEVTLVYSRVGVFADRLESWPEILRLNGLTYESLRGGQEAARLRWVARDPLGFHPQPYEQLADWYRRSGHESLARRALLAKQRARRATLSRSGRIAGYLLDWTVGYGYRPGRAALWLVLLVALGTTVFSLDPPQSIKQHGEQPHYNPFIYTLDLMLPIEAFGQRSAWDPVDWSQWLAYGLTASGWILATALIAGAARVLRPS